MKTVHIPLKKRSYDVFIDSSNPTHETSIYNILSRLIKDRHCFIITDKNVANLYLDQIGAELTKIQAAHLNTAVFSPGEKSKNLETVRHLYAEAVKVGVDRNTIVVALGGGVVGDTAGFMAASYMRGLDLLQLPTSLVAQVDSSIGGKTGVDLHEGKNLVGAFHQPKSVLIDITTLKTLPDRQLRCGLAEVVKYGVILDAEFFEYLESNVSGLLNIEENIYEAVILRCCELKAQVVTKDEFDTGLRAILNYGHTFGHALEKLEGYSGLTHGEAIAIGMSIAADLARLLNETSSRVDLVERQDNLFNALGLPTRFANYSPGEVLDAMQTDKKFTRGNKLLILPDRLGQASIVPGTSDEIVLKAIGGRCDR